MHHFGLQPADSCRFTQEYLSDIHLKHAALGLGSLPAVKESLRLKAGYAGYNKAADRILPPTTFRIRIPAHVLHSELDWVARPQTSLGNF